MNKKKKVAQKLSGDFRVNYYGVVEQAEERCRESLLKVEGWIGWEPGEPGIKQS